MNRKAILEAAVQTVGKSGPLGGEVLAIELGAVNMIRGDRMADRWCGCIECGMLGRPSGGWSEGAQINCERCGSPNVLVQKSDQTERGFLHEIFAAREEREKDAKSEQPKR